MIVNCFFYVDNGFLCATILAAANVYFSASIFHRELVLYKYNTYNDCCYANGINISHIFKGNAGQLKVFSRYQSGLVPAHRLACR